MRDKPYGVPKHGLAIPMDLYPLHCAHCQLLCGLYVAPKDDRWRGTDCSHCGKKIMWRLSGGLHVIEKSTETGQLYVTGSPI